MQARFTLIIFLLALVFSPTVFAAEPTPPGCQPLYNGGDTCFESNLLGINKKVLNPKVTVQPGQTFKDADFIENIGFNDTRYGANQATAFRIYVKNKSRSTLKDIEVKDIFPPRYLTFVAGNGKYDNASRTFTATIPELKPQETKAVTIQVLTARADQLPANNAALCTINIGLATVNKKTSQDTSQLCVSGSGVTAAGTPFPSVAGTTTRTTSQATPTIPPTSKGGLPVVSPAAPQTIQKTPDTGPELLALIGLVPAGLAGWALRKKTA